MTKYFFTLALAFSCAAGGLAEETVIIPRSSLSASEILELREDMRSSSAGWTEEEIDEIVGDGKNIFRYRESSIRAAFPKISSSDVLHSVCSNSVWGGATSVVFVSDKGDGRVLVKTTLCSVVEEGLECNGIDEDVKYYFESPKYFFDIGEHVPYKIAVSILEAFKNSGITGLPDWYKQFRYDETRSISSTEQGYRLRVGELYCHGCVAEFLVRLAPTDLDGLRLELVEIMEGRCI